MLRLSFYAIAAIVIAAGAAFAVRTSATSTVTPQDADVNKDGAVTIADAIAVLPHIGQLAPLAAPAPTIVGNRAFNGDYSATNGVPLRLFNTDDGSVVATFPVGVRLAGSTGVGTSCDGAYAMITTPMGVGNAMTVSIIRTRDGSTAASDPTGYYAPAVVFPCLLRGLGAQFNSTGPVANRAVVRATDTNSGYHLRVFDLTTGQTLYANDSTNGGINLSCSQDTVAIANLTGDTITIVRLVDGGIVTTIPTGSLIPTCAWN